MKKLALFAAVATLTVSCGKVDYKNNLMEVGAPYPEEEGEVKMFSVPKAKQEKVLPEGVYSIGSHAFKGCKNLESIIVPKSVNYIGRGIFEGCTSLKRIYYKA